MPSTRIIRRRIASVANTKKITKAMELVAASKMRKTVQSALASREYFNTAGAIVADISRHIDISAHPFFAKNAAKGVMLIVAASDRGLCGSFNSHVGKKVNEFVQEFGSKDLRIVTVGRRGEAAARRTGHPIIASFPSVSNAPSYDKSYAIGRIASEAFLAGEVGEVWMVYTAFKNALVYTPKSVRLLPIDTQFAKTSDQADANEMNGSLDGLFEPSPQEVLNRLLPRIFEAQVYQYLLESSASEHAARMMAMQQATQNAKDMLFDLKLGYNQMRQAAITREISEISAGKAALA